MRLAPLWLALGLWSCASSPRAEFPLIHLDIPVDSIPIEDKKGCRAVWQDEQGEIRLKVGVEYRGSASRKFPKRSYSIHIRNKGKAGPTWRGMTLQGDWVLYGPYADRSAIRNALAQTLFQAMGHYSPRSTFTELTIDTAYLGLYEWREKISLSGDRVPNATHILKVDKPTAKTTAYVSSVIDPNTTIRFHDSLPDHPIHIAFEALRGLEEAIQKPNNDWEQQADVASFIDYFLFAEWANSPDAYRTSCYFQLLSNGKWRMGPMWDFDLAFGNSNLYQADRVSGWRFQQREADTVKGLRALPWWELLYKKKEFRGELKKRWIALRQSVLSDKSVDRQIDSLATVINPVIEKDHARWNTRTSSILWTNPPEKNHALEIRKLKSWAHQRAAWMDTELGKEDGRL